MAWRAWSILALAVLAGCTTESGPDRPPSGSAASGPDPIPLTPGVSTYTLGLGNGIVAQGVLGVPEGGAGDTLVVFCHGFGGRGDNWADAMAQLAQEGVWSLAMDYRGAPRDWKVETGWQDTLAATVAVTGANPGIDEVVLVGSSMGGQVSGLVLAHAPPGLFDAWINGAGVMDLASEWAHLEASGTIPDGVEAIEGATGGTPQEVPAAYGDLSPLEHLGAIASHGLQRVVTVHGPPDSVVPFDHATRLHERLAQRGVPTSLYIATRPGDTGTCGAAGQECPPGVAAHTSALLVTVFLREWLDGRMADDPAVVTGFIDGPTGAMTP